MGRIVSAIVEAARESGGEGKFLIMELGADGPKPVYDGAGQLLKFMEGGEASRYSMTLAKRTGLKYQPRRINDDKWSTRERERFDKGEYQELPWSKELWWTKLAQIHGLHFPHVSTKNSVGLMAFTESPEKGAADIQTPIKPGRYLEQFFKSHLNPFVIRDMCSRFSEKFEENVVLMARTEDEIQDVYLTGPSSCMSHQLGDYASPIHPVRVYAAGDLTVAYLKREGRVVARTLAWPEKKTYNSIYGDAGRLQPLLDKMGYKRAAPIGARLLKVITHQDHKRKKGPKAYVVPHVDNAGHFEVDGDFLRIVSGNGKKASFRAQGPNGLSEWMGYKCDKCGTDDLAASQVVKVVASKSDSSRMDCWCPKCAEEGTFKCASSGYPVANEYGVKMWDGTMWWHHAFKEKGFTCEGTGLNYPNTERVALRTGKSTSKDYLRKQGGKMCTICNQALLDPRDCDTACKRAAMMKASR